MLFHSLAFFQFGTLPSSFLICFFLYYASLLSSPLVTNTAGNNFQFSPFLTCTHSWNLVTCFCAFAFMLLLLCFCTFCSSLVISLPSFHSCFLLACYLTTFVGNVVAICLHVILLSLLCFFCNLLTWSPAFLHERMLENHHLALSNSYIPHFSCLLSCFLSCGHFPLSFLTLLLFYWDGSFQLLHVCCFLACSLAFACLLPQIIGPKHPCNLFACLLISCFLAFHSFKSNLFICRQGAVCLLDLTLLFVHFVIARLVSCFQSACILLSLLACFLRSIPSRFCAIC